MPINVVLLSDFIDEEKVLDCTKQSDVIQKHTVFLRLH